MALTDTSKPSAKEPTTMSDRVLDRYDAGLLGDGGGGNVDWWQDYLRAELDRADDFYNQQSADLIKAQVEEIERWKADYFSSHEDKCKWLDRALAAEARLSSPVQGAGLGTSSPALPAGPDGPTEGPHSAGPEIRNALRLALAFAEQEAEQRADAGGSMSDYITEAEEVVDTVRAALRVAEELT